MVVSEFSRNKEERENTHEEEGGAVTWQEFVEHARGKTLEELIHESDNGTGFSISAEGPAVLWRYVKDPISSDVVDMRHFLAVGKLGELVQCL